VPLQRTQVKDSLNPYVFWQLELEHKKTEIMTRKNMPEGMKICKGELFRKINLAEDLANTTRFGFDNIASKYQLSGSCIVLVVPVTKRSVSCTI
jgi:hypothetical protein